MHERAGFSRILLSVPHMGGAEQSYVREAFTSNWLSTIGPNLALFEEKFSARIGAPSLALSSGTAAIHLGLRLLGVGPGDEVFCPTLTFAASCNPVRYLGAEPVFLDSDSATWNLDPNILEDALRQRALRKKLPRAVVVVHLYGQCADMDPILAICRRYEVPVLEDAAEALGATYSRQPAGSLGDIGVFLSTATRSSPQPAAECWSPASRLDRKGALLVAAGSRSRSSPTNTRNSATTTA